MILVAEFRDLVPIKDNEHARRHSITHGRLDELYAIIESEEARATGRTTFRSPAKVGLPSSIPRGDTFVPTACIMPERFFDKNVGGTLNLLRAAQALSIKRMLYIASTEVYGKAPSPKCDEKTELNPVNTYAVSKAAVDRLCHTYYLEHGVPVVIARIFCQLPRHRPSTRSAPSVPGAPGSFLSESTFQAVRVPRRSASQHILLYRNLLRSHDCLPRQPLATKANH
jgi:GDP-mannose 4,6 dehydratase